MPRGYPRITVGGKKNQVGERVRERRTELGMTQDGLCARIAMITDGIADTAWIADRRELARIEQGERMVSDLELTALAQALECDACWLLVGEPNAVVGRKLT
jgi:transcriptional regulator with XRE-family HTH domain